MRISKAEARGLETEERRKRLRTKTPPLANAPMKRILVILRSAIAHRFSLTEDKADDAYIIETIRRGIEFRGPNLWALVFAILVASIGLNVNSAAVIIGAMLISPLMGPIVGVGLGIAIADGPLLAKGLKNQALMVGVSLAASTFYFLITPIHEARSEILARTTPSLWDVGIALFGGLAGAVGSTRREKNNIIPGVAIATALMPPLCTAGFGLSIGNIYYFGGALYLFFINSVFICIGTVIITRIMKIHGAEGDPRHHRRMVRYILIVVLVTVGPSIYLTYRIVQRSLFEHEAARFVKEQMTYTDRQVVEHRSHWEGNNRTIEVLLLGAELPEKAVDTLRGKMPGYGLEDAKLKIRQGLNAKQELDLSQIKASILEDVYGSREARAGGLDITAMGDTIPDLRGELQMLYPTLRGYSINRAQIRSTATDRVDSVTLVSAHFSRNISFRDQRRLSDWLGKRLRADSLVLMVAAE